MIDWFRVCVCWVLQCSWGPGGDEEGQRAHQRPTCLHFRDKTSNTHLDLSAKIWPYKMLGLKKIWKGMKKGGKYIFSPQLVKSMYIYPNWLKIYKIATKKGWQIFACGAQPLIIINLIWGKNIIQGGGGPKYEFQIKYIPLAVGIGFAIGSFKQNWFLLIAFFCRIEGKRN